MGMEDCTNEGGFTTVGTVGHSREEMGTEIGNWKFEIEVANARMVSE